MRKNFQSISRLLRERPRPELQNEPPLDSGEVGACFKALNRPNAHCVDTSEAVLTVVVGHGPWASSRGQSNVQESTVTGLKVMAISKEI